MGWGDLEKQKAHPSRFPKKGRQSLEKQLLFVKKQTEGEFLLRGALRAPFIAASKPQSSHQLTAQTSI